MLSTHRNFLHPIKLGGPKFIVYLLVFLMALHITPATYIDSSFLSQFVGGDNVGYIFTLGSLLTMFMFAYIKLILRKVGNYRTFMTALMIDFVTLVILSSSIFIDPTGFSSIFIAAYILGYVARIIMAFNSDIFLEHFSSDEQTGGIRGIYLTSLNMSFVIGPFISSFLITDVSSSGRVYAWGAILLIPIIIITKKFFSDFKDSHYHRSKLIDTIIKVINHKDLSKIYVSDFILRFFYSWMTIYTPIFLNRVGFSLGEIALMMSFVLLPFVILELPLGRLADKYFGEKEIMTLGFIIMGISTISMFFINQNIFWIWAIILFVTRIGAAMIEITNETYLFKKISDADIDILSSYRSVASLTYAIAPVVASIVLIFMNIQYLFLILGTISLCGVLFSSKLRDTL